MILRKGLAGLWSSTSWETNIALQIGKYFMNFILVTISYRIFSGNLINLIVDNFFFIVCYSKTPQIS